MAAEPRRRIEVAAAVLHDAAGRFLLAQRPTGKAFEGYWEFPGGKVEPGESAAIAMCRELHEELGIHVDADDVYPWLTRDFEYPHAAVRLRFFRIYRWRGELHGREGQRFAWQCTTAPDVSPILPANGPILRALALPDCYGITQAAAVGVEAFLQHLDAALTRGLKLIQVREKAMAAGELHQFAAQVVDRARPYGARVLINGDAQLDLYRPSADKLLVGARCWIAAYNSGATFWVVNSHSPYAPQAVAADANAYDKGKLVSQQKGRGSAIAGAWPSGPGTARPSSRAPPGIPACAG